MSDIKYVMPCLCNVFVMSYNKDETPADHLIHDSDESDNERWQHAIEVNIFELIFPVLKVYLNLNHLNIYHLSLKESGLFRK